jgi:hypothetical protein
VVLGVCGGGGEDGRAAGNAQRGQQEEERWRCAGASGNNDADVPTAGANGTLSACVVPVSGCPCWPVRFSSLRARSP